MKNTHSTCVAYVLCLFAFSSAIPSVRPDDVVEHGRSIFKKYQDAVVTVQIVQKMKISMPGLGGQANETKQDLTGTVVDPSGLTVVALSSCEPNELLQNLLGAGEDEAKLKMQTELSDIKVLLRDGTEMPAEIVLRDKDLDLAFVRPKSKPAEPMTAVDLTSAGKADILDQVISLNRLGLAAGRAYAASVERITAVVRKPRLFYVPGSEATATGMGSPAFTLDGNLLGVFVTRSVSNPSSGGGLNMFNLRPEGVTGIIVPAEDIRKVAKQVPESKSGEAK